MVEGLRVSSAAETLLACACDLGLLDLLVLVDSALLRPALTYADGRAESAYEVLLRMLHVECGLDVEPQLEVYDSDGHFVARGDLRLRGTSMLHEYDGADHHDRARRLGRAGWSSGYTSVEVLHRADSILRDADASIGRPHEPARVRAWHSLLRDSLFTPQGTSRLRARLGPRPTPPVIRGRSG